MTILAAQTTLKFSHEAWTAQVLMLALADVPVGASVSVGLASMPIWKPIGDGATMIIWPIKHSMSA